MYPSVNPLDTLIYLCISRSPLRLVDIVTLNPNAIP